MAPAALTLAATAAEPTVVEQVVLIPVDEIDDSGRLRPINPIWAATLGRVMAVDGQDEPVSVCRLPGRAGWKLIAGGHRLAGARAEGWTEIRAVVKSADALDRRRREVSENLWRKGLDPLDRAAFVAELREVLRARAGIETGVEGRAISANVRWQKALKVEAEDASATVALAYGFADDIGDQVGLSRRTIYNDLELHRRLLPDVADKLRWLPTGRNAAQLRALAKLPDDQQRAAASLILSGQARSVSEAVAALQSRVRPSAESKRLSAFIGAFQRMGTAERRAALATFRQTFPGALDA
jgi:hypothetical protein